MTALPEPQTVGLTHTFCGDTRLVLPLFHEETFDCCVTSPPYYQLRDYEATAQIGTETTPEEYVSALVQVFRHTKRLLKPDGLLWLNLGDTYHKKELLGIPWMVAFAMKQDGWKLRSEIVWEKPNARPESVKDRPTRSHEQLFLFSRRADHFYDVDAVREPSRGRGNIDESQTYRVAKLGGQRHGGGNAGLGTHPLGRNRRSVWTIASNHQSKIHSAVFPEALVEPCVLASSRVGGWVLDPFAGLGTTGIVCNRLDRNCVLVELNHEYVDAAIDRLRSVPAKETNAHIS